MVFNLIKKERIQSLHAFLSVPGVNEIDRTYFDNSRIKIIVKTVIFYFQV